MGPGTRVYPTGGTASNYELVAPSNMVRVPEQRTYEAEAYVKNFPMGLGPCIECLLIC